MKHIAFIDHVPEEKDIKDNLDKRRYEANKMIYEKFSDYRFHLFKDLTDNNVEHAIRGHHHFKYDYLITHVPYSMDYIKLEQHFAKMYPRSLKEMKELWLDFKVYKNSLLKIKRMKGSLPDLEIIALTGGGRRDLKDGWLSKHGADHIVRRFGPGFPYGMIDELKDIIGK